MWAEEIGTHDDLMKSNKGYAQMFEIQSHYYNSGEIISEAAQV
jgi:hypothetical protein